jgi:hypothetical protein
VLIDDEAAYLSPPCSSPHAGAGQAGRLYHGKPIFTSTTSGSDRADLQRTVQLKSGADLHRQTEALTAIGQREPPAHQPRGGREIARQLRCGTSAAIVIDFIDGVAQASARWALLRRASPATRRADITRINKRSHGVSRQ